jgi:ribose transport system permease protein
VRTHWVLISVLTISAVCAAAAGMLHAAKIGQSSAGQNADLLLTAVACVVLGGTSLFGGIGGVIRTVVGVCIWGVLDLGLPLVSWIDEFARRMLLGIVLLAAMILNGLLAQGRFTSWLRRHTRG